MYDPLQVQLPLFEGPLDLLLHLVRKQELDINELRLSELTEPYLAYVERMEALDLDQCGEFLAIAATLIWIKSKTLLPKEALDDDELDPETLEEMLLLSLQELARFKDAAVQLTGRDLLGRDVFPRVAPPENGDQSADSAPIFEEVSLFALIEAFRTALERAATVRELHIIPERERIEDKVELILNRLELGRPLFMDEFFSDASDRAEVILIFLALLELVRLRAMRISQAGKNGAIHCRGSEAFLENRDDFKAQVVKGILGEDALIAPEIEEIPEKYDA
jgi:segregation and condensation protein A